MDKMRLVVIVLAVCALAYIMIAFQCDNERKTVEDKPYLYSGYYIAVREAGLSGGRIFENFTLDQLKDMISYAIDENTTSFKIKLDGGVVIPDTVQMIIRDKA